MEFADAVKCRQEIWERGNVLAYCIVDFSETELFNVSPDEVRAFAAADQQRVERIAIVAPADYIYGTCRIWLGRSQSIALRSQVFRTLDEAHDWLRSQGVAPTAAS